MDRRFLSAFTDPASVRMLGRIVYPFCLKHRVRLLAIDSPLLNEGKITPVDFMVAVQICAEEPIGRFDLMDRMRVRMLCNDHKGFEIQVKRFVEYVQMSAWPKFWNKNDAQKGESYQGSPWCLDIVCNLIRNGIPEQRAWEMPECQAVWYASVFAKQNGASINILSTEEEDFMEQVRLASPPEVKTHEPNSGVSTEG